ncbi:type I polyketide synthase [Streptomyces sp. NPDC018584]
MAVIAMGCRLPGGVTAPSQLWELLVEGRDAFSDFPDDRGWDLERLWSADADLPSVSTPRRGGFLSDVAGFDPVLFGISPREALAMDPQQRLLLETSWEALERAGISPTSVRGKPVGVFVGTSGQDYLALLQEAQGRVAGHTLTGSAGSFLSGRVAYALGLEGPAVTVDTASSASLVALHLACRALERGDCSLALAGGATVMSTPAMFVEYSKLRGLAPDGVAKPFSAAADGTAWAEGAGVLLLERLSDARARGHEVLAVIRGSAVNQDGASDGLTAPNGLAQQRVFQQALADAGLSPVDVDAVEAHGTGTALGDPVEAKALLAVYGQGRERGRPLWLGSLKSNFGHAQAAAGVAGVIKMVLSLTHGVLPKTLHVDEPTPQVDWSGGQLALLREARTWPAVGRPRRAAVSSFGISGTNAHVILEEPPATGPPRAARTLAAPGAGNPAPRGTRAVAWVVSAQGEEALRAQAGTLRTWAAEHSPSLTDAARALAQGRAELGHRGVVVAPEGRSEQLLEGLAVLARGESRHGVAEGAVRRDGRLAVLFTGQGAQRLGMGSELHAAFPVFAQAFDAACAELDRQLAGYVPEGVADVVFGRRAAGEETPGAAELLNRTVYTQAGLFAVETALFRLVESWGVRPDLLGGHSIGEVVAAHAAGVLSLSDAARLVAARGRLMQELPHGGAMAALEATEEEAVTLIGGEEGVELAAVNAPESVVISGGEDVVVRLAADWRSRGRKAKRLRVSHAFHSPRMEPMLDAFRDELRALAFHAPRLPVVSNVTGGPATAAELISPDYWVQHVRRAVRFSDGVTTLAEQGATVFLELGPEGVLSGLGPEALAARDTSEPEPVFAAALRGDRPEHAALLSALGQAWVHGVSVDWAAAHGDAGPAGRVDLPTYAFRRKRYWAGPKVSGAGDVAAVGLASCGHPLLGAAIELPDVDGISLAGRLTARELPLPLGRGGACPAGLLLELAVSVADEVGCGSVRDFTVHAPLVLPAQGAVALRVSAGAPDADGLRPLAVHSRPDDALPGQPWTRHATGAAASAPGGEGRVGSEALRAVWPPTGAVEQPGAADRPPAPGVRRLWRRGEELYAEVTLSEQLHAGAREYGMHPALLQSALDVAYTDGPGGSELGLRNAELLGTGATSLRVRAVPEPDGHVTLDAADECGEPVLSVRGLRRSRPASEEPVDAPRRGALYRLRWSPAPLPEPAAGGPGRCVIVGDDALGLRGSLMAAGHYSEAYRGVGALCDAIAAGAPVPDSVLILGRSMEDTSRAARNGADLRDSVRRARETVEHWATQGQFADSHLVFVTRRAIATRDGEEVPGFLDAPLWGLIRSAGDEHPGGRTLLDIDDRPASLRAVAAALHGGRREAALRKGALRVPHLDALEWPQRRPPEVTTDGTVLITDGTGPLGSRIARHLATRHGARRLLLTGAHASSAPGAALLATELAALGAEVCVSDCDPADADALAALLGTVDPAHPLTVAVNAAGIADPGADDAKESVPSAAVAAWNVHRLTQDLDLDAFVLFSAADGTLGAPHRPDRAMDACLLDALAHVRRAARRPAVSLAAGDWGTRTEGEPGTPGVRDDCAGFTPLGADDTTALLDAALAEDGPPVLVPAEARATALRARAGAGSLHPLLRRLVRHPYRRAVRTGAAPRPEGGLRTRLARLPEPERDAFLTDIVRAQVAGVLAHASPDDVDIGRTFKDLGLESLSAIEFRNRLGKATGLRLPTTLVRAYPTTGLLVRHLKEQLL